ARREPGAETVLGDVGDAGGDRLACVAALQLPARDANRPGGRRPHSGNRLGELALTVSRYTRNGDDLTTTHAERHVLHGRQAAIPVGRDPVQLEARLADVAPAVAPAELDLAADHQRRQ